MRTVALIQARLGSSRLPMKSLICLRGLPIVDWVVRRVSRAKLVDQVVVAIPDTPLDDVLADHLQRQGVAVFRGPEDDVLRRFRDAGRAFQAEQIVRVCADNPLIWGEAIDQLLRFCAAGGYDYAWNHIPRRNLWPDGLGAETLSQALLEELDRLATEPAHREHCLSYIWDNAARFRMGTLDPEDPALRRPDIKMDIDTREDYRRLALLPIDPDMDAVELLKIADGAAARLSGAD